MVGYERTDAKASIMENAIVRGWRTNSPSNARVYHVMVEGAPLCNAPSIVITDDIIDSAPRAFPPRMVKKLRELPICAICERRMKKDEDLHGACRARISELETEIERLKSELVQGTNSA